MCQNLGFNFRVVFALAIGCWRRTLVKTIVLLGCTLIFSTAANRLVAQGRQAGEKPAAADKTELDKEFEKLQLRLSELEDDFVDQKEDATSGFEGLETFSKTATGELKKLNEVVDALKESVTEIEDTLPQLVYHTHKSPKMVIFGRMHLNYVAFSDIDAGLAPVFGANPQDRFGFRRLRLGVSGDINDNMLYKFETEFANPNRFSIRDAYLGFTNLPLLQTVTIGNQKRPYSLDQWNSSNDNVFIERPFIADSFNDNARRLGIMSAGFSENERFNWQSGIFNMQNIQDVGTFFGDNYQLELASRFAATPWYDVCSNGRGYLHVAVSSAQRFPDGLGPNNLSEYSSVAEELTADILDTGPIFGAESESLYGLETVLNVGPFQLGGEYAETFVDRFEPVGPNLNFHGGYFYAAYMLTGEHMPWNRQRGLLGRVKPFERFFIVRDCNCDVVRGWGAWQIAARYSYLDLTDEDVIAGQAEALTLGLNWFWNENARLQFNYLNGDVNRLPLAEGNYDLFGMQFEVFF